MPIIKVIKTPSSEVRVIKQPSRTVGVYLARGEQGPVGPVGPVGPQGPGLDAGDIPALVSYVHVQGAASSLWTIGHQLGFYPNVTVFDSGESQVEGSIDHVDINNLTIAFSAQISGKAHLS